MKFNHNTKKWGQLMLFFLLTAGMQQSCKKEDTPDSDEPERNFLVSYEKVSTIPGEKVQLGFSLLTMAYPEIGKLNFGNPYAVDIYKVTYRTTLHEDAINASGIVCVPDNSGSFPVLSFQNGTNTKNSNAPSNNINNEQFALLENLAGLGYIVTIPDYVGFGASSGVLHPYYHRASNDAAVINLIRATEEMLQEKTIKCQTNGDLFMLGYSQGGWATLSAFNTLEANNPTGLTPVAASCGAGAYDLMGIAKYILGLNTYGSPVYLPYFIESHRRNGFLDTSLDLYFNKPYLDSIPRLFDGDHFLGSINSALNDTIKRLMTPEMLTGFVTDSKFEPLRNELVRNSVSAWPVKGKILFVHGKNDPVVPVFESEKMVGNFRELGINQDQVELMLLEGADHGSGILPWAIKSLVWLDKLK